jgi:hypothetical protein
LLYGSEETLLVKEVTTVDLDPRLTVPLETDGTVVVAGRDFFVLIVRKL